MFKNLLSVSWLDTPLTRLSRVVQRFSPSVLLVVVLVNLLQPVTTLARSPTWVTQSWVAMVHSPTDLTSSRLSRTLWTRPTLAPTTPSLYRQGSPGRNLRHDPGRTNQKNWGHMPPFFIPAPLQ